MSTTTPTFTVGQRVIVPGTPHHMCKATRQGGPGVVVAVDWIRLKQWVRVRIDESDPDTPSLYYLPVEIKPEPTV